MRIVFMGTPDFAVVILKAMVEAKHQVVGVVTVADKPSGRGQKVNESAVKKFAASQELFIMQPEKLKDEQFVSDLKALSADLFVVVAFRMLPEVIWSMPSKGTINLHGSLLPQYRGAAPINWAIINGEKETGVTSFFIEKEIDTGKILIQEKIKILENQTAGEIHDLLAELGASVILKTIDGIQTDTLEPIDQATFDLSTIKHAPKIFKEDGQINWNQSAQLIHNFIRGLSPYPGAYTYLYKDDKKMMFKIFGSKITNIPIKEKGFIKVDSEGILFPTENCYLRVDEIQMEGKRRMTFKEFQAGNEIQSFKTIE
ncbi:MAG: methionyl-tRNA formyltransferase [Bacteroidetes bacterium]|nr:methionyl-tRNA formyltransferase [Bacteroidota bacterium]